MDEEATSQPEQEPALPGVLVFFRETSKGRIIGYEIAGGLDHFAVPTLLEKGLQAARKTLELD